MVTVSAMRPDSAQTTTWQLRAHAIVLAAGGGSRFGGRKMLASWRGEPLILASTRIALAAPVERVTVVTGAYAEDVERALDSLRSSRLVTVRNEKWSGGLNSSLAAGISSLPDDADCALIFLGDMPLVPEDVAGELLRAMETGASAALVEIDKEPGHPVAIGRNMFSLFRELRGESGARRLLEAQEDTRRLKLDCPGCLFDVDTLRDL